MSLSPANSFGSQKPERRAYEFDGKLPVISGRARVAMQLIEAPWNYEQRPTGSHGQDPWDYYSLAGAFCIGPVDRINHFYFINKQILYKI